MNELPGATASFDPIATFELNVDFETFVHMALSEISTSFDLLEEPDDDVAPSAVIAEGPTMYLVQWHDVAPALVDRFLTHVVPPTLAARDTDIAGLMLTTYITDPRGERIEAALFSVIETDGQMAREQSLAAEIHRSQGASPRLDEWQSLDTKVTPAIARALYAGLLGTFAAEDD